MGRLVGLWFTGVTSLSLQSTLVNWDRHTPWRGFSWGKPPFLLRIQIRMRCWNFIHTLEYHCYPCWQLINTCLALEQLESAHPRVTLRGSLQLPKPSKTFPVKLLLEPVLYCDWPHPEKIICFSKIFCSHYPIEESFLKKEMVPVVVASLAACGIIAVCTKTPAPSYQILLYTTN